MRHFSLLCSSCFDSHRLSVITSRCCFCRRSLRLCHSNSTSSSQPSNSSITVHFERGLPRLNVPLPSRQEPCQFSLRPLTDNVGGFCEQLQHEDRGLDHVALYTKDGVRIAMSTSIEHLLQFDGFRLRLNDRYYDVTVPIVNPNDYLSSDRMRHIDDLRAKVASLHACLCVDEYKVGRERRLIQQLEKAESELRPLHEKKLQIERDCDAHAERIMWAGFAAMGVQTGIFARLTWWEYSWDIMEPVTYFSTYSTVIATFGYYLYTRQTFEYPSVRERVMTKQFYKRAIKERFDIEKYNKLVTEVENIRNQLARIRDPLFQHLPVSYLSKLDDDLLPRNDTVTSRPSSDGNSVQ